MIEFYLGEEPILDNVPTWLCREPDDLAYVLEHLDELVVKGVHGAGGYGMLVGPAATQAEIEDFRARSREPARLHRAADARAVACPTFVETGIAPRHIDLRPFVLSGKEVQMVPGGLTRVALKEGSLVVNSSQGGGTKDTWVLEDGPGAAMLERTADHLYWMARYIERAENTARMLDVNYQTSLLPQSADAAEKGWGGLLSISEWPATSPALWRAARRAQRDGLHGARREQPVGDPLLPARARENARAVRGTLTTEVWETQNQTWLEFQR